MRSVPGLYNEDQVGVKWPSDCEDTNPGAEELSLIQLGTAVLKREKLVNGARRSSGNQRKENVNS